MHYFNPLKNKWSAWGLWFLWAFIVLKFSSEPAAISSNKSGWILSQMLNFFGHLGVTPQNTELLHTMIRKFAHMLNYFCMGLISFNAFRQTYYGNLQRTLLGAFLMTAAFAGIDEFYQTFIPGRSGQLKDVLIDSLGTAIGLFMIWSTKAYLNESEDFLRYRIDKNIYFGKIIVSILIVFECLFIMVALWSWNSAPHTTFQYLSYTVMYVLMILVSVFVYWRLIRFKTVAASLEELRAFDKQFDLYNLFVIIWGAFITLMDQALYASLNAYFINLVVVTTLFQHTRQSLNRLFIISVALVYGLLPFFQPSLQILLGHYVNGSVFIIIFWFASKFLHRTFIAHYEAQTNLEAAIQKLEIIAIEDSLTGLPNRRGMERFIKQLESLKHLEETYLGVLIIDIDHFKQYNDSLGHLSGDEALKRVAVLLGAQQSSMNDYAVRYGGEEFLFLSIHNSPSLFQEKAEGIRQSIEALGIAHPNSQASNYITVSIGGFNEVLPLNRPLKLVLEEADKALYMAKHSGRNKVTWR